MKTLILIALLGIHDASAGQEIEITEMAPLDQVYMETYESEVLLPMNDLDVEFGYVLYETEITVGSSDALLEFENVRDYAAVYVDGRLIGSVTDRRKSVVLDVAPGEHTLQLYAENIGRITYGPEILDNYKGLFGKVTLHGGDIGDWTIVPLAVRESDVRDLNFGSMQSNRVPGFYKGYFDMDSPADTYLDVSGWGMGEVWINGRYAGSFWEEEKQQSIMIPAESLREGNNEVVVFELKNNGKGKLALSEMPVFK